MTAAHNAAATAAHALALLPAGKGDPTWLDNPALTEKFGPAILETLMMTGLSTLFAVVIGTLLGLVLVQTGKGGLTPNNAVYQGVSFVVNIVRSLPFIIGIIMLIPLTKLIVGKSTGSLATVVPLVILSAPFFARLVETNLLAVNYGYNRWQDDVMISTVVAIILIVQVIQLVGDIISRALDHRAR